jgi:hypothetical protein
MVVSPAEVNIATVTLADARPHPRDDALPGFDALAHAPLPGPVSAIYDRARSEIQTLMPIQAAWRPGKSLTMRYRVSALGGDLDGSNDIVAVIGDVPEGISIVAGPDGEVGVWVLPDDPLLPGLESALDVPTVSRLLADLGSSEEASATRLRAYRPGRRAVVQVEAGPSSLFLKVTPPSGVEALHERHRILADHVPVPDSLGLAPDLGIVVMRALPGSDLRTSLRSGRQPFPEPTALASIPQTLPDPRAEWRSWAPEERLAGTVDLLARLLPEEEARLQRLVHEIGDDSSRREVPVHGDFHEAQILTAGRDLVGLIDVDTFGWGHAGDDEATMLAHLHLLAPGCHDPRAVIELARSLNRIWDSCCDPVRLRLKTAAHVLGLATGPFRVQSENWPAETRMRIDVAEQWVDSARTLEGRGLLAVSGSSQARRRS